MSPDRVQELLSEVAAGRLAIGAAAERLATLPFEDSAEACVDHHRSLRCGTPEVIFGERKTPSQIVDLFQRLRATGQNVLATRVAPEAAEQVSAQIADVAYHVQARTLTLRQQPTPAQPADAPRLAIVAAGTTDLPVAEEARITAELLDCPVRTHYDVGVAGLHRLLARMQGLREAAVVIVVAGMEGALPSVVGGLVAAPVIAVPTSVGYGASFGGLAALLGMLNSCASGVSVVNIDNGFGAAYQAAAILRQIRRFVGDGRASGAASAAGEVAAHG